MSKRAYDDPQSSSDKRQRYEQTYGNRDRYRDSGHQKYVNRQPIDGPSNKARIEKESENYRRSYKTDHGAALQALPPQDGTKPEIPSFVPFTVSPDLPPLPAITDATLAKSPFLHKSRHMYDRSTSASDITYERLEFLGDAYLELMASRLIFHHFPSLPAGSQSQVRELLVKNETLSEYARLYAFERKVEVSDLKTMIENPGGKGNKGINKILGDVFEAYIAALVLSDPGDGFARAEKWLTALWAPKLLEAAKSHKYFTPGLSLNSAGAADSSTIYNPTAKADLQHKLDGGIACKLVYEPYKAMVELKGNQVGQNRHYIALHLTGYGYERKLLGKGEGKNKVEAGNWAAADAMFGECRAVVEECEEKYAEIKVKRRKEKEEREVKAKAQGGSG